MDRVGVVIAGGGMGTRMKGRVPKQFLLLNRRPIITATVALMESLAFIHEIVLVVPSQFVRKVESLVRRGRFRKVSGVISGGSSRQESVWNGLHAFEQRPDIVLVHDAVRPLVSQRVVRKVLEEASGHGGAVVGTRVKDTIKVEGEPGFYAETLDRSKLWVVQTPQGFSFDLLLKAHEAARASGFCGTDEASLVERMGVAVKIVEGDWRNIKITTREDLELAKLLCRRTA